MGTTATGPLVQVFPADGLGGSSATLRGTVNPNGFASAVEFEYGPTTSYGSVVSVVLSPDNDTTPQQVSAALTDLAPGTLYHWRLRATNAAGTGQSTDQSFTTLTAQQSWRQQYFGTPSNAGAAADDFDYDNDGLANLLEYAFGLHPKDGSSAQLPSGQTVGSHFVLSFSQPAGVADITYGAEWSPNLLEANWTSVPNTGGNLIQVFSVPVDGRTTIFMRFRIAVP